MNVMVVVRLLIFIGICAFAAVAVWAEQPVVRFFGLVQVALWTVQLAWARDAK